VAGALARELGRGLLSVDAQGGGEVIGQSALGPWCTLAGAMLALHSDPGPGETIEIPTLSGYGGPVALVLGREGGLSAHAAEGALNLALPPPDRALRRRYWDEVLAGTAPEVRAAVSAVFHLSGGFIRQVGRIAVAQAALNGSRAVRVRDVQEAARSFNHERLDTLADRLEARGDFSDLIVAEATMAKLRELERLCRHRERLLDHLGPAFGQGANRGVRALFSGVSGTGKTMAARMLAAELGMELYRVDLAAVVNKYIGETEKNLSRVLSRAEALDVVLLVDEGDALFGRRTEVRSANDRYANLETNYLLQRLEHYQGIVLVTTNLGENIDRAFQRRMDVVVPFFSPRPEERRTILERHLPTNHRVDAAYLDQACARCALTGGQLRNVALQATLLAIDDGGSVAQRHLQVALQGEYRKAGGIFPLREAASAVHDDGLEAFVAALRAS
jgi:AAA+ superfamily predicted ATPase